MTDETPTRGEVWLVRLPRAVGAELQRDRPAVVVSSPVFDSLAVRIVVPLTTWRDEFAGRFNKFLIRGEQSTTASALIPPPTSYRFAASRRSD